MFSGPHLLVIILCDAVFGPHVGMVSKARNSACPLARDKWIFRRTTKITDFVVRRTSGSRHPPPSLVKYFGVRRYRHAWHFLYEVH